MAANQIPMALIGHDKVIFQSGRLVVLDPFSFFGLLSLSTSTSTRLFLVLSFFLLLIQVVLNVRVMVYNVRHHRIYIIFFIVFLLLITLMYLVFSISGSIIN